MRKLDLIKTQIKKKSIYIIASKASAIILGALNSFGKTEVTESIKSRDHTEKMLKHNTKVIKIKMKIEAIFPKNKLIFLSVIFGMNFFTK